MDVIRSRAEELGIRMIVPEYWSAESISKTGSRFLYDGGWAHVPLMGRYQIQNAATAWETCKAIGIPDAVIRKGIENTSWPGRLQLIPGQPDVLIDSGHNPAGIDTLAEAVDTLFPDVSVITVMAMMRDKDYPYCIPPVARRSKLLIAASTGLPRSLPPDELAAQAQAYCSTMTADTVPDGIRLAFEVAKPDALILICGSVYAAGDAVAILS